MPPEYCSRAFLVPRSSPRSFPALISLLSFLSFLRARGCLYPRDGSLKPLWSRWADLPRRPPHPAGASLFHGGGPGGAPGSLGHRTQAHGHPPAVLKCPLSSRLHQSPCSRPLPAPFWMSLQLPDCSLLCPQKLLCPSVCPRPRGGCDCHSSPPWVHVVGEAVRLQRVSSARPA